MHEEPLKTILTFRVKPNVVANSYSSANGCLESINKLISFTRNL